MQYCRGSHLEVRLFAKDVERRGVEGSHHLRVGICRRHGAPSCRNGFRRLLFTCPQLQVVQVTAGGRREESCGCWGTQCSHPTVYALPPPKKTVPWDATTSAAAAARPWCRWPPQRAPLREGAAAPARSPTRPCADHSSNMQGSHDRHAEMLCPGCSGARMQTRKATSAVDQVVQGSGDGTSCVRSPFEAGISSNRLI